MAVPARLPYPLRLAQGHLTLLATCPRKFQHGVLDQLGMPEAIDQQARLQQGERFHRLVQQWLLHLPIVPLLESDGQLHQWFAAFQQASPQILASGLWQPESDRIWQLADYLLTVRYDLLILGHDHAKILDWKTYARPPRSQPLERHWQTRLYSFVLAETSAYPPEQISMIYWFFPADRETTTPQSLALPYTTAKHEETRQDLTRLLTNLTHWLDRYQTGEPFPQVGWNSEACVTCNFAARCGRTIAPSRDESQPSYDPSDRLPDRLPILADIVEISL